MQLLLSAKVHLYNLTTCSQTLAGGMACNGGSGVVHCVSQSECVQDEKHVLLECSALEGARNSYSELVDNADMDMNKLANAWLLESD